MKNRLRASLCLRTVVAIFIAAGFITASAKSSEDVVVLKNGDRMTGEIKGLQRGELKFKADYMAESVRLDWTKVQRLESKSTFIVSLVNGRLFTSTLRLLPSNSTEAANFAIVTTDQTFKVSQLEVLRIIPVEAGFWRSLEGSIDLGFSFTSGNDQYQTQLAATTTYRTGDHSFTAALDSAFSGQTQGNSSKRREFTFDYRKQLTPKWYAGGLLNLLSSDQQSLSLRTSIGGLAGRNIKRTETSSLSLFGGLAISREKYSTSLSKPSATNADGLAGVDFMTFRFKTTEVTSRLSLLPSLTVPGRLRLQANSDLRIKVVKDLYWGFHLYENFDSKPPVRADKNDLSISTSLGWKF